LFTHDLFGKPLHTFPDHALGATAHEFVKTPLPFPDTPSHICPKPGDGRERLTKVNAVGGFAMKMPLAMLRA
jgi:hypothetical protein